MINLINKISLLIFSLLLLISCDENKSVVKEKSNLNMTKKSIQEIKNKGFQLYESFNLLTFNGISQIHSDTISYPFIGLLDLDDKVEMKVFLSEKDTDTRVFKKENDSIFTEIRVIPKDDMENFTTTFFSIYQKGVMVQYTIISDTYNTDRLAKIDFHYKNSETNYQLENDVSINLDEINIKNLDEKKLVQGYGEVSKRTINLIMDNNEIIKIHEDGEKEIYKLPSNKRFYIEYYFRLGLDENYNKNIGSKTY